MPKITASDSTMTPSVVKLSRAIMNMEITQKKLSKNKNTPSKMKTMRDESPSLKAITSRSRSAAVRVNAAGYSGLLASRIKKPHSATTAESAMM